MTTLEIMIKELTDINIEKVVPVDTPRQIKEEIPLTYKAAEFVTNSRKTFRDIMDRKDDKLIVITGPCSIHDYDAAIRFGRKLKDLFEEVGDKIHLVMRTYFEKPRTIAGWEGLIHDPDMDGSCNINEGYRVARRLLLELAEMGVPTATEIVDIGCTPNYIDDLVGQVCIGARTAESQYHRKVASGLSMPVSFKNTTGGDIQVAVDAVGRTALPSTLLGMDNDSRLTMIETKGHNYACVVLRGGNGNPNYHPGAIDKTVNMLEAAGLKTNVIVDCSHKNSGKDYSRQPAVWDDVIDQRVSGNKNIIGLMLEANHLEGSQDFIYKKTDQSTLNPDMSVTDSCISIKTQDKLIREAYRKL